MGTSNDSSRAAAHQERFPPSMLQKLGTQSRKDFRDGNRHGSVLDLKPRIGEGKIIEVGDGNGTSTKSRKYLVGSIWSSRFAKPVLPSTEVKGDVIAFAQFVHDNRGNLLLVGSDIGYFRAGGMSCPCDVSISIPETQGVGAVRRGCGDEVVARGEPSGTAKLRER